MRSRFIIGGRKVVVLDLDKQGSATDWADRATEAGDPLPFPVHVVNMKRLVKYATDGDDQVVIIDTPPPGDGQVIDAAIGASNFVIMPTAATGLDTARVWETLPSVQGRLPYGILITSARLGTNLLEDAKQRSTATTQPDSTPSSPPCASASGQHSALPPPSTTKGIPTSSTRSQRP